jgi:hypothetical protein
MRGLTCKSMPSWSHREPTDVAGIEESASAGERSRRACRPRREEARDASRVHLTPASHRPRPVMLACSRHRPTRRGCVGTRSGSEITVAPSSPERWGVMHERAGLSEEKPGGRPGKVHCRADDNEERAAGGRSPRKHTRHGAAYASLRGTGSTGLWLAGVLVTQRTTSPRADAGGYSWPGVYGGGGVYARARRARTRTTCSATAAARAASAGGLGGEGRWRGPTGVAAPADRRSDKGARCRARTLALAVACGFRRRQQQRRRPPTLRYGRGGQRARLHVDAPEWPPHPVRGRGLGRAALARVVDAGRRAQPPLLQSPAAPSGWPAARPRIRATATPRCPRGARTSAAGARAPRPCTRRARQCALSRAANQCSLASRSSFCSASPRRRRHH